MSSQRQLLEDNCGQTCVAMLAGITQYDAMHAVGNDHGTSPKALSDALERFGFIVERKRFTRELVLKGTGIALLRSKSSPTYGHAAVFRNGCFEDPSVGHPIAVEQFMVWLCNTGRHVSGLICITGKRF